jgi:carboxyl-terminal processing protease
MRNFAEYSLGLMASRIRRYIAALLSLFPVLVTGANVAPSRAAVFAEVCNTAREHFYDPKLNGVDWSAVCDRYAPLAEKAKTTQEFAAVVNQMLGELRTSHTHYYTPHEPEYFQLAGIFWPVLESKLKAFLSNGRPDYVGIGIFTAEHNGRTFVADVLSGFPAQSAGLRVGDEILAVDGKQFEPISSFIGRTDQPLSVMIRRSADGAPQELPVVPKLVDPTTMFLDAMKASVEIVNYHAAKVGYLHIWSYAGEVYQDQLEAELDDRLHDADALVIDLRDGWGGASPSYLRPFLVPPMTTIWRMRDGKEQRHEEAWTKPVCLLVNENTRSGKELLTYYFKKAHRGLVVGIRTAGAVLPGKPFVLSDGSLLFLAVGDGLIDGHRPEGNGVVPDVQVPFPLEYADGKDPQKERAIELVSQAAHRK